MDDHPKPAQPRIAPAPPPPAAVAPGATASAGGFQVGSRRVAIELSVVAALVVGLGVFAVFGGGWLASQLTPFISTDVDRRLGQLAQAQLEVTDTGECENPEPRRYVEQVLAPLLQAAAPLPFTAELRVVNDPEVNAFALPGGFVTVNFGLLEEAESGEEVAGVLAHELQHALLRHGTRRVLRGLGVSAILGLLTGGGDLQLLGGAASDLVALSYDREQESEADRRGVALLQKAGIDPSGLARFFERLAKSPLPTPPALLSTHPDPGDRARWIREGAATTAGARRSLPAPGELRCD
jgi:predicted Zn-dependent protease